MTMTKKILPYVFVAAAPVAAVAAGPASTPTPSAVSPVSYEAMLSALSNEARADIKKPKGKELIDLKGRDSMSIGDYDGNKKIEIAPMQAVSLFSADKDPAAYVWTIEQTLPDKKKASGVFAFMGGKLVEVRSGRELVFDPKSTYKISTEVALRRVCENSDEVKLLGKAAVAELGLENILLTKTYWMDQKQPDVDYSKYDGVYVIVQDAVNVGGAPAVYAKVKPFKSLAKGGSVVRDDDAVRDLDVTSVAGEFNEKLAKYCEGVGDAKSKPKFTIRTLDPLGRYIVIKNKDGKEAVLFPIGFRGDLDATFARSEDVVRNTVRDQYGREFRNAAVSTASGPEVKFDGRYDWTNGLLAQARVDAERSAGDFTRNAVDAAVLGGYSWDKASERLSLKAGAKAGVSSYERAVGPRNPAGVPILSKSMTDLGVVVEGELEGRLGDHVYDIVIGAQGTVKGTATSKITGIPQPKATESRLDEKSGYLKASTTLPGNNVLVVSGEYLHRMDADQVQQFLATGLELAHYIGNELKGINILRDNAFGKAIAPLAVKGGVVHVFRLGDGPKGSASEYRLGLSYGF